MKKAIPLPDLELEEFLVIEEQILSSIRGRAFLRMRDRRASLLGRDDWQAALGQMRDWITQSREETQGDIQLDVLRRELVEMAASIRRTKAEIAALRPDEEAQTGKPVGSNRHIDLATEELSAIVRATEGATSDILNGAERLMEVANALREPGISADELGQKAAMLEEIGMETMTACGFQDITGQRISKVVNALRYIEERIDGMIRIWGPVGKDDGEAAPASRVDGRPDAHLLNGPALHGAMDQSSIDSLMADLNSSTKAKHDQPAASAEADGWSAASSSKPAPPPAAPAAVPAPSPAAAKPPVMPEEEIDESAWGLGPDSMAAASPKVPAVAMDQSAIDNLFA